MKIEQFEKSLIEMGIAENIVYGNLSDRVLSGADKIEVSSADDIVIKRENDKTAYIDNDNQIINSAIREKYDKFEIYREYLVEKNKYMNLTNIVEKDEVYKKHFLDSLSVFLFDGLKEGNSVIDIGTGAGFPAVPMKIMMPSLEITLMDSLKKRVNFLEEVGHNISLDMNYVHGRAEDYGRRKDFREKFDIAVSRAVANFSTLLEYALPFVKVGGFFIALKGRAYKEELESSKRALKELGSEVMDIMDVNIPCTDLSHKLIIVKKHQPIVDKYPRKAGTPQKKPL